MNPRLCVDFNEMPNADEVLLAQGDIKRDNSGVDVELYEGKAVAVYMDDFDAAGTPDRLMADGIAAPNTHAGWASASKWVLKIDSRGIRRESAE